MQQFVTVTAPSASTQPALGSSAGTAAFLLLILALTPVPSHAGEIIIGFFLYPKKLNPGKIKVGP